MDLNRVFLAGHITRDPQLSFLPSQTAVVDIGIAINRRYKSKAGEQKEEVCFVDCTAFGKTAESINKYFGKGKPILVEGRLKYESWKTQEGKNQSKLKVIIDSFQFVGAKDEATEPAEKPQNGSSPKDF